MIAVLLTSLGLALPAGLNAWIPVLVLALTDRFTDQVTLAEPFDVISTTPGILVILLLLPIELVADKIPGVDHVSDLVHTAIRPVVGALLAAAVADGSGELNAVLAGALGLGGAAAVHGAKAASRPVITVSTGGVGNPIASMIEDAVSAVTAITAVFLPFLMIVTLPLFGVGLVLVWQRLRRGSERLRRAAGRPS